MKPKKSLGQNFLTSIPAKLKIIGAGNIEKTDTILEIGPGKGSLTGELLKTEAKIIAVEKDAELQIFLNDTFSTEVKGGQLTVIHGDILALQPETLHLKAYKIIANIPYYITGAIIEKFLTEECKPTQMVLLIQKEVAERIVARDGKESILSLSVKAYGDPRIVCKVNKGSFFPVPSVDSAVISIENISQKNFTSHSEETMFFRIVKAGFSHKRKKCVSNLKEHIPDIDFEALFIKNNLSLDIRAEDMVLSQWLTLTKETVYVSTC